MDAARNGHPAHGDAEDVVDELDQGDDDEEVLPDDEIDADEWQRSGTSLRAIVPSDKLCAAVLGVTAQGVQKAAAARRIARHPDGTWHVFQVVADWRAHTRHMLQRPGPIPRPWLDPWKRWTPAMRGCLLRRVRTVGGVVQAYNSDTRAWVEAVDPLELLRTHAEPALDAAFFLEVDLIAPESGLWRSWFRVAAPAVAEMCGVDAEKLIAALATAGDRQLHCLLWGALFRHGWTADLLERAR